MTNMQLHEQMEEVSRKLVEVQIDIQKICRDTEPIGEELELEACESEYFSGPPQVIKLVIPEFLPRLKVHPGLLAKKNHLHPTTYGAVRDRWFNLIARTFNRDVHLWKGFTTFKKALVWIHMYVPQKNIDIDNFTTKFINDALVFARIMEDDNYQRMIILTSAEYEKFNPKTQIKIREGWEIDELQNMYSGQK